MAGPGRVPLTISDLTEASDWDTTLVITDDWMKKIVPERRHSGWEAVEKQWIGNKQSQQSIDQKPSRELTRKEYEAMERFPYPQRALPVPQLEFDFRMKVILSSQSASVAVNDGFKKWSTFSDGSWSGRFGYGLVVNGGQESQDVVHGKTAATWVEGMHRLQTEDEVPAYIECKTRGNMTGPPELVKALQDPGASASVDPRSCLFRVFVTMKTTDERYAEKLNAGMWIGSCLWKGLEVIYDAYRVS
ncbi:hypothetical protein F5Y00DRAFT_232232 [Daldinia vernicosa]|uniref:uncharacterized protein n=1 Tax=Daldinia vernicosa TaxID=114800 RepID=UPI00200839AC|nr:uncharacterized protein F5Y00DRAFT_232232 [Daldinia vernicosa]KAI0850861.1 hypothetical protein F5Y00DRAFT_232232 [Daldinia vernicosa]